MPPSPSMSEAARDVHRHDRERFVTALFAPEPEREALLTLYAFNLEIARVRENVREGVAGLIRLQWWRDVLNGERDDEAARHPVAGPLLALVRERQLSMALFDLMLTAREQDLAQSPFATRSEFAIYAQQTAGTLAELAVLVLGETDGDSRDIARQVGRIWATTGLLRALPVHLAQGWLTLPAEILTPSGCSTDEVLAGKASREAMAKAVAVLGRQAAEDLRAICKRRVSRRVLPAVLSATLAAGHLRRLERAGWDVFDASVLRPRPMPLRLTINALFGWF